MTDSSEARFSPEQVPGSFTHLVQQGVARVADFHKFALDVYAHHAVDVLNSWKRIVSPPAIPGVLILDAASQSIEYFVHMQKNMLDILIRQGSGGIAGSPTANPQPAVEVSRPVEECDAADTLISEQEDAQIAARVVDRIAELVLHAGAGDDANAAMQQTPVPIEIPAPSATVLEVAPDETVRPAPRQRNSRNSSAQNSNKRSGSSRTRTKNQW